MCTFAVESGFAEAIIRGFRSSFFNEQQYTQIKNCTTLDELKTVPLSLSSSWKILTTVHTCYLTTPTSQSHLCAPASKENLLMKSNMFKATLPACLSTSSTWSPSDTNLTTLSTSYRVSRTRLILNCLWITLILLDISLKWEISKFLRVMITQDSTEMCLLIPLLDPTSWNFWRRKWLKKEEIPGPWMKFKISSRSWNLNISEPPSKNCGWKIFLNSAKFTSTLPPTTWWKIWSNSKLISKPSKSSTTPLEIDNSTQLPKSSRPERNYALPLDISTPTAKPNFSMPPPLTTLKTQWKECQVTPSWSTNHLTHPKRKIIQSIKNLLTISCMMKNAKDMPLPSTKLTK